MAGSIFDFESEDRVESPEKLNEYVRVASPRVWVLALALLLVLISFVVWGITGRIPKSIVLKGVVDKTMGYDIEAMLDASQFTGQSMMDKRVVYTLPNGESGTATVIDASQAPFSRSEMTTMLGSDFLAASLIHSDYTYVLDVKPDTDLSSHNLEVLDVTIITSEVQPISFLFN